MGVLSALRQDLSDKPMFVLGDVLRRVWVNRGSLWRAPELSFPGVPVGPVVAHEPNELVALSYDPCSIDAESVFEAQRVDTRHPCAEEVVHAPSIDRISAELRCHRGHLKSVQRLTVPCPSFSVRRSVLLAELSAAAISRRLSGRRTPRRSCPQGRVWIRVSRFLQSSGRCHTGIGWQVQ